MKLPPFSDFTNSLDMDKISYDLEAFSPMELKQASSLFTQEQYSFIAKTIVTMNFAFLQQYHQWLIEQLPE